MSRYRDLGVSLEGRRGDVERISDAQAQFFHVTGEIQVIGSGEAVVDVLFPVWFTEKPRFSYGSELFSGEAVTSGNLPTCSVVVLDWDDQRRADNTLSYSGASFAIVTSGPTDQIMIVQWHMQGVALRSPTS